MTKVKICCISSIQEAQDAIRFGASALGLVGDMPSGPGIIDDELIATINKAIPPPIASFLLTSETSAENIIEHHKKANTNTIQLVDAVSVEVYAQIRISLPTVKIVQVIHVLGDETIDEALHISNYVDALLLDSGNPNLAVKELGGTGRTHNWNISRKIREQSKTPIFLAGGLKAENVRAAIEVVEPFGIDLCSGVRTNGKLDLAKLERFFDAIA